MKYLIWQMLEYRYSFIIDAVYFTILW
jgi:hypothetical protein